MTSYRDNKVIFYNLSEDDHEQRETFLDNRVDSDCDRTWLCDSHYYPGGYVILGDNKAYLFDRTGKLLFAYTVEESPLGRISRPKGLAIDPEGRLLVWDDGIIWFNCGI